MLWLCELFHAHGPGPLGMLLAGQRPVPFEVHASGYRPCFFRMSVRTTRSIRPSMRTLTS
jgi:hypothetical protein